MNLRYQHASDMRADLQRLKRDTESSRQVPAVSGETGASSAVGPAAQTQSSQTHFSQIHTSQVQSALGQPAQTQSAQSQ